MITPLEINIRYNASHTMFDVLYCSFVWKMLLFLRKMLFHINTNRFQICGRHVSHTQTIFHFEGA